MGNFTFATGRPVSMNSGTIDSSEFSDESAESITVVAVSTEQVDANTTRDTLVLATTESRLPNLNLNDVLQNSTMVVEVDTTDTTQTVTVRAADIEAAFTDAHALTDEGVQSGTANFLLLKNGWAYTALQSSPLDLPIGPLNQQAGNGWTLWRELETGVYEVQNSASGEWNRLSGARVDTSPKSTAEVAGAYTHFSSESALLSTSSSTETLQLSSEGVFTSERTSLDSNGLTLQDGSSYITQTVYSPTGREISFSGVSQSDSGSTVGVISNEHLLAEIAGDMFGSFRILEDGMTLELQYADGTTKRQLYLKQLESGAVSIGGEPYVSSHPVQQDLLANLYELLSYSAGDNPKKSMVEAISKVLEQQNRENALKHVS